MDCKVYICDKTEQTFVDECFLGLHLRAIDEGISGSMKVAKIDSFQHERFVCQDLGFFLMPNLCSFHLEHGT